MKTSIFAAALLLGFATAGMSQAADAATVNTYPTTVATVAAQPVPDQGLLQPVNYYNGYGNNYNAGYTYGGYNGFGFNNFGYGFGGFGHHHHRNHHRGYHGGLGFFGGYGHHGHHGHHSHHGHHGHHG